MFVNEKLESELISVKERINENVLFFMKKRPCVSIKKLKNLISKKIHQNPEYQYNYLNHESDSYFLLCLISILYDEVFQLCEKVSKKQNEGQDLTATIKKQPLPIECQHCSSVDKLRDQILDLSEENKRLKFDLQNLKAELINERAERKFINSLYQKNEERASESSKHMSDKKILEFENAKLAAIIENAKVDLVENQKQLVTSQFNLKIKSEELVSALEREKSQSQMIYEKNTLLEIKENEINNLLDSLETLKSKVNILHSNSISIADCIKNLKNPQISEFYSLKEISPFQNNPEDSKLVEQKSSIDRKKAMIDIHNIINYCIDQLNFDDKVVLTKGEFNDFLVSFKREIEKSRFPLEVKKANLDENQYLSFIYLQAKSLENMLGGENSNVIYEENEEEEF